MNNPSTGAYRWIVLGIPGMQEELLRKRSSFADPGLPVVIPEDSLDPQFRLLLGVLAGNGGSVFLQREARLSQEKAEKRNKQKLILKHIFNHILQKSSGVGQIKILKISVTSVEKTPRY